MTDHGEQEEHVREETWTEVADATEIREGEPYPVVFNGIPVALYRFGDDIFATANRCTHGSALLSDGWQDGDEIECPLHQGRFDIRTGRCTASPVIIAIRTFPVRIFEGKVELTRRPRTKVER